MPGTIPAGNNVVHKLFAFTLVQGSCHEYIFQVNRG